MKETKELKIKKSEKKNNNTSSTPKVKKRSELHEAINSGWAYIEFDPKGVILDVNDNFIATLGYTKKDKLIGKHHKIFCRHKYAESEEYSTFWENLGDGNIKNGEFIRKKKDGSDVWINASYTPIKNEKDEVVKVIKIASDVTEMVQTRGEAEVIKTAVNTSWASIEFAPDGTIISANENFVNAMGYDSCEEFVGDHHKIFCQSEYVETDAYKKFWEDLAEGKAQTGEFKRKKKDGSNVWINASYTPFINTDGDVVKIIKIANDITNIKEPVMVVSDILNGWAQGDLTNRYEYSGAKDYVEQMGLNLNITIKNSADVLRGIQDVSSQIAASSDQLLNRSNEMQQSTFESSAAIEEMASGAQQQAIQIDDVSKLIENVLVVANSTSDSAQEINVAAEDGQTSANEGLITIKKLVTNMSEIKESADVTSSSIDTLTERSEEIARTLNVITDIATQTNLLALNAAIEAARAGDAGRGFAVVAEEIRKLAEDSRKSATTIERVISDVQKDVSSASKAIDSMGESVEGGNKASMEVEQVFQSIEQSSLQTLELSKDILAAASDQKEAINESVKNIEKIVVVAEETAAGTEQISSVSRDLSNGMEEVTSTSNELSGIALELQEKVAKFQL